MSWQPIASAPKDGSPMLMYCPELNRRVDPPELAANTIIGFWLDASWRSIECEDFGCMGSSQTGWMSSMEWIEINPTHWMPIPEPPKQGT